MNTIRVNGIVIEFGDGVDVEIEGDRIVVHAAPLIQTVYYPLPAQVPLFPGVVPVQPSPYVYPLPDTTPSLPTITCAPTVTATPGDQQFVTSGDHWPAQYH